MKVVVPSNDAVAIDGVVGVPRVRNGANGPFAVADVAVATGDTYTCIWWDSKRAPLPGTRVAVRGTGSKGGDVSVTTTNVIDGVQQPREHHLLDYYRACLEAEVGRDGPTSLAHRSLLDLSTHANPFTGADLAIGGGAAAKRWMVEREVAGRAESIAVCWPVVVVSRDAGPGLIPVLRMEVVATEGRLVPQVGTLDIDEAFLRNSELTDVECQALRQEAQRHQGMSDLDYSLVLLDLLDNWGLLTSTGQGETTAQLGAGIGVKYCAVALAAQADYSAVIRRLVAEFEELKSVPVGALRSGPLGILFGSTPSTNYPEPRAMPSVMVSNLEQERAISASTNCLFTVVTGPPGTGKSQVLANAVAAALSKGERVLLASKNNHAIDVVTERVNGAHHDAHVVRLGNSNRLAPAADALTSVIKKTPQPGPSSASTKQAWAATAAAISSPYNTMAERARLRSAIDELAAECSSLAKALPNGVGPLTTFDDTEFLIVAHQRATNSSIAAQRAPRRWFWQRRQWRRLQDQLTRDTHNAASLVAPSSVPALMKMLTSTGCDQVLKTIAAVIDLSYKSNQCAQLTIDYNLLPSESIVEQQITDSYSRDRLAAAVELFGAGWRERLYESPLNRAGLVSYHTKLSAAAQQKGSAVYQARDAAVAALPALPVWAVTSLSVGGVLPLHKDLFDLVIIDEASQSDIASAIPLLYRAKRAMIIGDPHQLSHITNIAQERDAALARYHDLDPADHQAFCYPSTSLYSRAVAASSRAEPIFLKHHFRSHPDISGFASNMFYGGALQIDTHPTRFMTGPAVRWEQVQGTFANGPAGRSAINRAEASRVINVLTEQLDELEGTERSIGIVSPFRAHVDYLIDLLATFMPDAAKRVTIDTAYGFQGDERDVIILSPVVSATMPEKLQKIAGQSNLINVAITRARARLIVVGDGPACAASGTVLADLATHIGLRQESN